MKEIRYLESVISDKSNFKNTLRFRLVLFDMILVKSTCSILDESTWVFNAMYDILADLIITQRPRWKDFLIGAYAMGKKSFNNIEFLLEQETSFYSELEQAMKAYLDEEKRIIDQKMSKH